MITECSGGVKPRVANTQPTRLHVVRKAPRRNAALKTGIAELSRLITQKHIAVKKPHALQHRAESTDKKKPPFGGLDYKAGIIPLAALIRLITSATSNVAPSNFCNFAIALSRSAWIRCTAVFGASASPSSSAFSALRT